MEIRTKVPSNPNLDPPFVQLTKAQFANALDISEKAAQRLRAEGKIQGYTVADLCAVAYEQGRAAGASEMREQLYAEGRLLRAPTRGTERWVNKCKMKRRGA